MKKRNPSSKTKRTLSVELGGTLRCAVWRRACGPAAGIRWGCDQSLSRPRSAALWCLLTSHVQREIP